MKTYTTLLILILSFSAYSQRSNEKHDIGLRLSSFQPETFQLEYRFHTNEKWAFNANFHYGLQRKFDDAGYYVIIDSLYQRTNNTIRYDTYGINLGAIRKLSFMKHNYYYVGVSVGLGASKVSRNRYRTLYMPMEDDPTFGYAAHPAVGDVIEQEDNRSVETSISLTSRIFAGLDVPILDRLELNVEGGLLYNYEFGYSIQLNGDNLPFFVTGGLRYQLGKINS